MSADLPRVEALDDGGRVLLRRLRPEDGSALVAGFERLSPRSRFLRFFSAMPRLMPTVLEKLVDVDAADHVAIVAFDPDRPSDVGTDDGLGVGVARFIRSTDDPVAAEAAVAVIDEYHGRGIGRCLFETLEAVARDCGIERFEAEVLAENRPMRRLFRDTGGTIERVPGTSGVVRAVVPLGDTDEPKAAAGYDILRRLASSQPDPATPDEPAG